ncbi:MAG TPA: gluconokinase [Pyrinomonadaceae bacterium]|jgi:gluconokinase|nr:gluconokinase [Pyrinomonadaceae bacterium]
MSNVLDEVIDRLEPLPALVSVMATQKTPALLGLDIGTSGVRAALFDERGREIGGASIRVDRWGRWQLNTTDFSLLDADTLLEQVAQTLDALFAKVYQSATRIELIAISCFWHSLLGVNATGRATTPVLGWADSRAAAATYQLRSELDEAKIHARTGCRFHPSYWPAKLRRLRTEEPEIFSATKQWLSFTDYLTLHFFGETAVSVSMASGTGLMNQHTCEWDEELLDALGLSINSLPEIAASHKTFRDLRSAYARRWPQLSEARLVPPIGDGAANNIGAGCNSTEKLALMIGTGGALRVCFAGAPPDRLPPELWCYRANRQRILIGGALSDGGGLYNWIRESLLPEEDSETIERELELLRPDAHGLTILPFWSGERSTGWNPDARGAILGLRMQTRPIEILRAAMESIAYRFALIAEALEPFAREATLIASGHALRSSSTWVQILADVLGRRVLVSELSEASLRGAALLALEAAGKIRSIEEFSVPVEAVFESNMSHHATYRDALDRQQLIYKKIFAEP